MLIPSTTKDLGRIPVGKQLFFTYDLINDTDAPIKIDDKGAQCGCTTPSLSMNPIPPNTTAQFKCGFTPNGTGKTNKSAWIDIGGNRTSFYFKADVF